MSVEKYQAAEACGYARVHSTFSHWENLFEFFYVSLIYHLSTIVVKIFIYHIVTIENIGFSHRVAKIWYAPIFNLTNENYSFRIPLRKINLIDLEL